ncbi:hypothetical protein BGX28_007146 [Mortierella sp. GBA30]|nr:hypothetical protein BGX28_007146 [Mortierella sp. GBA30]
MSLTWYNANPSSTPDPAKLSCARVDAILFIFRLHQSGIIEASNPAAKPILAYLESAYGMAIDMNDLESMRWVSNAFYNYGGALFKSGKQKEAIRPLEAAIQCLRSSLGTELSADHSPDKVDRLEGGNRSKAEAREQLANRYEVLGVCFLAINDLERALESFNSGLCALPMSSFKQIDTVAQRDMRTSLLPAAKLLIRRSRTMLMMEGSQFRSVVTSVPEFEAKITRPDVPMHMKGIVQEYECGLLSVLSVRTNQATRRHEDQIGILKHLILRVYRGGRALVHPVRRARVLVQLAAVYQGSADLALQQEALNLIKEAIEILKERDLEHDQDLELVRNHHLAMAYSWQGILDRHQAENGQVRKSKPFQIALQLWEMIVCKIECFVSAEDSRLLERAELERVRRQLPEPELLFDHLRMLADCLGMVDYRVMQVQIYLLMLRLCNGVLPISEATCADAVRIYARMGQAYLALGYSGKAKMALNHGKLVLEEMARTSDDSSLRGEVYAAWLLAHSLYLTSVGHKDQSVTAYNQAKYYSDLHQNHPSLITGRTELWNGATISKKVEAKVNWAMILVEASLARSQLLYHEGDLSEAISDAMRAYRQLCRIVGTLSSAIKAAQKDSTLIYQQPLENPFLVQAEAEAEAPTDGMSSASQHHQRQQAKQERPSTETKQLRQGLELLATQRYQWSIFRLIIETFHQLSKLYLVQGSAREAEFFVLEGKHIALLSRAGKSVDRFLLDQAQLGLRKHQWTESQNILQELVSQEDKSNAGALNWEIHDARIQLLYGDLYFATGRIDRSLQAYYRTDEVLSHLMDKSFISGLEQLVIREPQTPREKRLATVYHHQGMRQVRSLSSVTLHSQDTDGGAGDQAQFECVVLSGIKAAMGYRTSIIFGRLGQRTEAYGLIEKSKAEDPKAFTAAEYHSVKAKMLMLELEDAMAKHLMYAMIPDSALSVGLFKKTRTQQPAPPPTFCTQPPYLEDHMAPPSLMMHAPMDMDPISSSPSVRVTRMTRRRRSQLVNQQLHSPLHSRSTGPSGCGTRSLGEGVNMNSYLRMLTQAKEHLSEAYRYSVKACPPHIIADICGRQAYLAILESCFHQDLEEAAGANIVDEMGATLDVSKENHGSDYSLWRMANRASCYLETAKAVTQRREMYGLIKQKLNPALPQEDQTWPRDIQIKSPEHSHSQRMHQQWTQPPTSGPRKGIRTERRGRKTINYSGLEKPRRLRLQMTDDDDDVALHARIGADVDDEDEEIDEDLEVLGMKPKDLKTRRGYRHYLDQQQLLHPSTSLGNERSFLEALEMAYGQDLDIHDGDHAENFQQDFVDILPEKWTVVSISMDVERETLYVNRLRANAMPVVVRLPLNRAQLREGDDQELGFRLGSGMGSTGLDDEEESPQGEPLSYKDAVEELEDILAGSQETLDIGSFASSATGSSTFARPGHDQTIELTREIKAEWWSRRQRLDDRLCALLGTMEDQWLCGLKGLIQSHNTPADSENLLGFKRTLEWIMSHAVNSMSSFSATQGRGSHSGASAQGSWIQLEVNIELCRVILHLGDQPSFLELKDLIYFLLDAYLYKSVSVSASTAPIFAAPSSPSMGRGFEHASSPRSASTASTTTPAPYIEYSEIQFGRIAMQIKEALRCYWLAETEAKNNGFDEGAHVILILDKHLQAFPWESCPALRGEAVSRMPSIWFLRDRILQQRFLASTSKQEQKQEQEQDLRQQLEEWKDLEVDPQRTFYILNPTGDLKNTEREFETYVQSQEGWDGIIGRVPLSLEYMNALSKNELYIYFGHSGGEQYIKTSQIRQLGHCAVSLLLGCSSGSLKGSGEFDPTGNAMNYLLAGCPTLVANLWDVTDRDLDRFSKALFSLWGLDDNCRGRSTSQSESRREGDEGESMEDIAGEGTEDVGEQSLRRNNERLKLSIVEAVKEARDECRLKYLVGAATVVYGIPCFLKRSPRRV